MANPRADPHRSPSAEPGEQYDISALLAADSTYRLPVEDLSYSKHVAAMRKVGSDYQEFCAANELPVPADPFNPAPAYNKLMAFLIWLVRTRKGLIGEKLSTLSLKKYANYMIRGVRESFGASQYSSQERRDLMKWIDGALVKREKAEKRVRPKPLASSQVIVDLLHYLWACDEYEYTHPRTRLHISLSLLLLIFLGLRPGELVESSSHAGSNEGVRYKDVTFMAVLGTNGRRTLVAQVRIRNRKFARGQDGKAYTMCLMEDAESPQFCPLAQLLTLAIADGALEGITSAKDLQNINVGAGRFATSIPIRQNMRELPVIRRTNHHFELSPTDMLQANKLGEMLSDLGVRAGHSQQLTPYAVRRGHGNMLNRFVSAVERRRQFGHKSDDTFLAYVSSVSGVDTQSMVHGRAPNQEIMGFLQSMLPDVDLGAAVPLGTRMEDGRQLRRLRTGKSGSSAAEPEEDTAHGDETSLNAGASDSSGLSYVQPLVRPKPSGRFKSYLNYDRDRTAVIDVFYDRDPTQPFKIEQAVAALLPVASSDRQRFHYPHCSPDETGACRDCGKKPGNLHGTDFNKHLLQCEIARREREIKSKIWRNIEKLLPHCRWSECRDSFRGLRADEIAAHLNRHANKSIRCRWGSCKSVLYKCDMQEHFHAVHVVPLPQYLPHKVRFCYDCAKFFRTERSWNDHCTSHLEPISDKFCGSIMRRDILMAAKRCPFCLGDEGLAAATRCRQWPSTFNFNVHVKRHLLEVERWPIKCPHPLCSEQMGSARDFWLHAENVHNIAPPKDIDKAPLKRTSQRAQQTNLNGPVESGDDSFAQESLVPCPPKDTVYDHSEEGIIYDQPSRIGTNEDSSASEAGFKAKVKETANSRVWSPGRLEQDSDNEIVFVKAILNVDEDVGLSGS